MTKQTVEIVYIFIIIVLCVFSSQFINHNTEASILKGEKYILEYIKSKGIL